MSNPEKKGRSIATVIIVFVLLVAGGAVWLHAKNESRSEAKMARQCTEIFGIPEVPNPKTSQTTFRHQTLEAAKLLSGMEVVALQNPGDGDANAKFEEAYRVWASCFDPERTESLGFPLL